MTAWNQFGVLLCRPGGYPMANLRVEIAGLSFRNPILPGAGPQVDNGEKLAAFRDDRTEAVLAHPDPSRA